MKKRAKIFWYSVQFHDTGNWMHVCVKKSLNAARKEVTRRHKTYGWKYRVVQSRVVK